METFRKRDIVIFPFPYTDLTNSKLRPCLVLSQEMRQDIILCQITSKNIKPDKFSIELKDKDTKEGSLKIDSNIRTNMLFTANKNQVIKKICNIDKKKYSQVTKKIRKIIEQN